MIAPVALVTPAPPHFEPRLRSWVLSSYRDVAFALRDPRFALERVSVGGCEVGPGERVICLISVANRDPEVFADPDRLDVGRRDNRHLAFGSGIHSCLGANLARLEARVVIGELLRRFPRFEQAPPGVAWRRSGILRVPTALPLALAGAM